MHLDVSMVAVALATLFAVVRRPDLSSALPQPCLEAVFQVDTPPLSPLTLSHIDPSSTFNFIIICLLLPPPLRPLSYVLLTFFSFFHLAPSTRTHTHTHPSSPH